MKGWGLLACVLFIAACTPLQEKETITVGILAPLTGPVAEGMMPALTGMQKAVQELENEGIHLELIVEDNKNDPKESIAAYQRMRLQNPDIIISTMSGPTQATLPLIAEDNKPVFMTLVISSFQKQYNNSFRYFYNSEAYADALIPFLKEHDIKTLAIYYQNIEAGKNGIAAVQKQAADAGITIIVEAYAPKAVMDHKTSIAKLAAKNPDALFIWSLRPDQIVADAKQAYHGTIIFNEIPAVHLYIQNMDAFNDTYHITTAVSISTTAEHEQYTRILGNNNTNGAFGYDLMRLIGESIAEGATPQTIIAAVEAKDMHGLVGSMHRAEREANAPMYMAYVENRKLVLVE